MPSSIAKYYRRKEVVLLLNRLSEKRARIDAFTPHLDILMDQTIFTCADILNQKIYRARLNCPGELFTHTKQLTYPPSEKVIRKSRFNDIGESIFYGSLGVVEPIFEVIPTLSLVPRLFTLSTINKINQTPFLTVSFGSLTNENHKPLKAAHRVSIEYMNSEVTRIVEDNDYDLYNAAISIGRFVMKKEITGSPGSRRFALAYPSVKAKNGGANIAMLPELFDEYFKFDSAHVCCIAPVSPDKNIIHYLNKGEIDPAGNISWLYNYSEMMTRIRNGLVLDMKYEPDNKIRPEVVSATDSL